MHGTPPACALQAHIWLLLIGWGFFAPIGVVCARCFKQFDPVGRRSSLLNPKSCPVHLANGLMHTASRYGSGSGHAAQPCSCKPLPILSLQAWFHLHR